MAGATPGVEAGPAAWPEHSESDSQAGALKGVDDRQAVIRRLQGESFLLATQVKQLEQQIMEASRDAQTCSSQLAQVLQLMDSTGGRVPLKGEVDRARVLVTAARRSIRRVSCWSSEDPHSSRARQNGDRKPSPRPQSPREPPKTEQAGLAASAAAAVGEVVESKANGAQSQGAPAKSSESRQSRSKGAPKESRRRREHSGEPQAASPEAAAAQERLAQVQQACIRQRELLVRAVRKGAQLEEKVTSMADEVIKKDVIIHNLRQDMSGQQQELKQQQLQFEQHLQQVQQQHLQQLQQQACQIQELQLLQIQRLQKDQEEAVCLPLEPSFGSPA